MPNDMRPRAPSRSGAGGGGSRRAGMNPLFAGIIIGLLLGIFLALGVAIWLNRTSNPFVERTKPVESLPAPKSPTPPPGSAKADPANPDKPRFEFYQILPGEKEPSNKTAVDTPVGKESPKDAAKEASKEVPKDFTKDPGKEAAAAKSLNEVVYLQAGAFQSETDAENLKAKIAFAGFEASVKPVNVAGKGTLFRVRLGPYKSQDEVNRIKNALSQNGIGASVVKAD